MLALFSENEKLRVYRNPSINKINAFQKFVVLRKFRVRGQKKKSMGLQVMRKNSNCIS